MITQKRLKELLSYNPETGAFTWKKAVGRAEVGDIAGHWRPHGYVKIQVDGTLHGAHRLAWLYMHGEFPKQHIDHIDHNGLNNSISNLRCVSHRGNQQNQTVRRDSKSGIPGVTWYNPSRKWRVAIRSPEKLVYLGTYGDINAAIITRKVAEFAYGFHPNHGKVLPQPKISPYPQ